MMDLVNHMQRSLKYVQQRNQVNEYAPMTTTSTESDCTITGLELKVSKIRELKKRLFAISKRLQDSSKEKADLMQRIGNMEIQLLHLKEIKVEEDFKRFTEFHKDLSEQSRLNLMTLINDTKEMMDKEERTTSSQGKCSSRRSSYLERDKKENPTSSHYSQYTQSKMTELPKIDWSSRAAFFHPSSASDSNQKWLRRHLMKDQGLNLPSICESTPVLYCKKPKIIHLKPVESQVSQSRKSESSENKSNESLDQLNTNEQTYKTPCGGSERQFENSDCSDSTEPSGTNAESGESSSAN